MSKTAQNKRAEFEKQLQEAITKNGEIQIKNEDGIIIDLVSIAEPKGLYGVDEDTLSKIEAILQSVEDGRVMVYCKEYGVTAFEFDFVGSKAACYKYLHKHEQQNTKRSAELLSNQIDRLETKTEKTFSSDSYSHLTPARHEFPEFEYKEPTNLINDAAEQLSKHYGVSFIDARGAMEQAIKEVETLPKYNHYRDSATNKVDFKEVVLYARDLLTLPF